MGKFKASKFGDMILTDRETGETIYQGKGHVEVEWDNENTRIVAFNFVTDDETEDF